jgi:acyl-CoA dehydrogenase
MADKGYTAPTWPSEYGGGGLSEAENKVLQEEMAKLKLVRPTFSMGLWMFGPTLLEHGTHEQKLEHLPKIVRSETNWCQGFSEPGAGSDLASLQMRAVPDGDHFVVNGQKIWTSGGQYSDWMFALVRTDTDAAKHNGHQQCVAFLESLGCQLTPPPPPGTPLSACDEFPFLPLPSHLIGQL